MHNFDLERAGSDRYGLADLDEDEEDTDLDQGSGGSGRKRTSFDRAVNGKKGGAGIGHKGKKSRTIGFEDEDVEHRRPGSARR